MADIAVLGLRVDASGAVVATEQLGNSLNRLGERSERTESKLGGMVAKLLTLTAAAATMRQAVTSAQAFEKQMALVATVTDTSVASITVFSQQVLTLFRNLPVGTLDEMTKGLYDILSAGIPAGKAIEFLDISARAATAGVTSTAIAVDGLTSVVNSYATTGLQAQVASDQFFKAIQLGKTTFAELAGSIGKVTPLAAAYGVELSDVLAATAALTLGGINTAESITGLRGAFVNILKPTEDFKRQFPELAKEFNSTKLETAGLVGFLREFSVASGGSKEALNALFTEISGKTAVLALLKDGGEGVADILTQIQGSAGSTGEAFEKATSTSAALFQILKNRLTATLIELGTKALPTVNSAMALLIRALSVVSGNLPGIAAAVAASAAAWGTYAVASRAAAIQTAVLTSGQAIAAFARLAIGIRSAAGAMALLSIVGKGAAGAVAAIAAMAVGYLAFQKVSKSIAADQAKFTAELERTTAAMAAQQGVIEGATAPGSTASVIAGPTPEQVQQAVDIRRANEDRNRLTAQALALEGKIGVEYERQLILNEARNAFVTETRDLTNEALIDEVKLSIEKKKQADLSILEAKRTKELQQMNRARVTTAADALVLATLEGRALAEARVDLEAGLDIAEARLTLRDRELSERIKAINLEAQLKMETIAVNDALAKRKERQEEINTRAKKILEDQTQQAKNFELQFLQTVSSGFEGVLKNGFQSFNSFTNSIKDLFIKMFADLLAANVFKRLTTSLGALIPGAQFDPRNVANANFGSPGATTLAGAAGLGVGAAAIGFGVGSRTTNRGLGFAAGAATGAAFGTVVPGVGNVVGAVVGGIVGGLAGLLGSANAAKKSAEAAAASQKRFNITLDAMRISIEQGSGLDAAIKKTATEFQQLRESAISEFSGKKAEAGRATALAEINRLEALRIKQLREEFTESQRRSQLDLKVRELRAKGLDAEATAVAFADAQVRELAEAQKNGADTATLAALAQTQLAESQRFAADAAALATAKIEGQRRALFDLANETQNFSDPRGASAARDIEDANNRIFDAIAAGATVAELAALSLYNAAVLAARAAARVEEDRRTTEGLTVRGLTASGNTRAAEDASQNAGQRQELADAIKSGFSPTNLALLQFVQFSEREAVLTRRAIEDGTKAINDAAAAQMADLDVLIEVTRSAAKQQIALINGQIEEVRAAGAVSQKGFDNQIAAAREESKARTDAIDAQIAAARSGLDIQKAQLTALEKQVQTSVQVVEALTKFTDSLQLGDLSTLSPEEKLAEARRQFETLASSASGGDAGAATELPAAANALLQASRAFNASNTDFAADFNRVNQVISAITTQFGATLPIDQEQLATAREQLEKTERTIESLQRQKEAVAEQSALQIAKLEELKAQDAEATKALIDALERQRDKVSEEAEATIAKLEETKQVILETAQRQIEQLIADENAKLQTRLRENEFYDLFKSYADQSTTYFALAQRKLEDPLTGGATDGISSTGTSAGNPTGPSPVQVALETTVAELKEVNRQLTVRLAIMESQIERLIDVAVGTSEREVSAITRGTEATRSVAAEVRSAAQQSAVRRPPVGIAGR